MTEKRDKVNVDDIIGLIKTDEPTNSVEEVRKLRGRETKKRFTTNYQNDEIVSVHDNGKLINIEQMVECLNNLHEENEQLNQLSDIRLGYVDRCAKEKVALVNWITHLEKENEQLKKEVEDLKQALIRCAFDDK